MRIPGYFHGPLARELRAKKSEDLSRRAVILISLGFGAAAAAVAAGKLGGFFDDSSSGYENYLANPHPTVAQFKVRILMNDIAELLEVGVHSSGNPVKDFNNGTWQGLFENRKTLEAIATFYLSDMPIPGFKRNYTGLKGRSDNEALIRLNFAFYLAARGGDNLGPVNEIAQRLVPFDYKGGHTPAPDESDQRRHTADLLLTWANADQRTLMNVKARDFVPEGLSPSPN